MKPLELLVGLRLGTGQNDRRCWQAFSRDAKRERAAVWTALWLHFRGVMPGDPSDFRAAVGKGPWLVTVSRISPGPGVDAHDNLPAAAKHVVDEVAAWLGIDDRSPLVTWRYAQERGPWGVRLRIEDRP